MKKNICLLIISTIILIFGACERIEVSTPKFDVTLRNGTVKVNEPVFFDIKDYDAEQVNFYSGEEYNEYHYSLNNRYLVNPHMSLTFNMSKQMGSQADQFRILVSTNFNNNLDEANIKDPNVTQWADITHKFTLPAANSTSYVSVGTVDMSEYFVHGLPFYLAFQYIQRPQNTFNQSSLFAIQNLLFRTLESVDGNKMTVFDQAQTKFRIADLSEQHRKSRSYADTRLCYLLGPEVYGVNDSLYVEGNLSWNDPYSEVWAISSNLNVDSVDIGYDKPKSIVRITDPTNIREYNYSYSQPGTYKAVFVAKRNSIEKTKELVKEFTIKVLPE